VSRDERHDSGTNNHTENSRLPAIQPLRTVVPMTTAALSTEYIDSGLARRARITRGSLVLIALCVVFGIVETLQQHIGNVARGDETPLVRTAMFNLLPWLPVLPVMPVIVWLAERWPLDQGRWKRSLPLHLITMLVFILFHQYLSARIMVALFSKPLDFSFMFGKMLSVRFAIDALVYWTGIGVTWAARVSQAAREREQAAARLEATLVEARLGALRDQLNPHFLFNTLNAISTLALRDDRYAVVGSISALSDLLRRSLDTRQVQEVPLAEELELAGRFLEIQQIRFGDRLTIVREIPADLMEVPVPVMILQPLLENAFQHGVSAVTGPVTVGISARRDGHLLILEVSDTGSGLRMTPQPDGIGLRNTRERLRHLYGDRGTLQLEEAAGGGRGTIARVTLPLSIHGEGPEGEVRA
jgi:two-component system LytT family sensor kinase